MHAIQACLVLSLAATAVMVAAGLLSLSSQLQPLYLDQDNATERYAGMPRMPASGDDLHWLVQVTDIHVSKFHDPRRVEDLRMFGTFLASHVHPLAVIASGDLTDAKDGHGHGSRQFLEEWVSYKGAVDDFMAKSSAPWLDIRGNHDTFNVAQQDSPNNMFREFSAQGSKHSRTYSETIEHNGRTIGLLGIDATAVPGIKRAFNFFGILDKHEVKSVKNKLKALEKNDYSIVFGHYPVCAHMTPCTWSRAKNLHMTQQLGQLTGT